MSVDTSPGPAVVDYPPLLERDEQRLLIDGQWVSAASGKVFETLNPATGVVLASIARGGQEDVDRAVRSARRAFEGDWSRFSPYDRQDVLLRFSELFDRHFEELTLLDTLDMGVPLSRSRAQGSRRFLARLRFYAGLATTLRGETIENSIPGDLFSYTRKEPVGVVGAIIPWNSPLMNAVWKLGPVLATGCTMVLKPSEEASLSTLRLGELLLEAGVPDGVVNIITGFGSEAGAAIASHPDIDKIAFTGSDAVGQDIVRASAGNLKRVTLELGGKSPDVVFADADLDAAVPIVAMGAFGNTGQVCAAGTRLFVQERIYDEFVARVAEFGSSLTVGNGLDPLSQIGPLVSRRQLERVTDYIRIGREEGARTLSGGQRLSDGDLAQGNFVAPTVFTDVRDDMRIAQEEIFGPVISAVPFADLDDAIARSNRNRFGLGSGVWTRDVGTAHRFAAGMKAGAVWVNCYNVHDPAVPFGGYKMSGYGREGGVGHVEEYLNVKSVWIKTN